MKGIKNPFTGNLSVSRFSSKSDHVLPLQGGMEGSVLTYHCGPDQYPFPVSSRLCGDYEEWSVMRSNNGRQISRAICKGNSLGDDYLWFSIFKCINLSMHPLLLTLDPLFRLSSAPRHPVSGSAPAGSR